MLIDEYKDYLRKRKTKNCCFVRVRVGRFCFHCRKFIDVGTECLTVNPKGIGRRWYCNNCVQLMLNVAQAKAAYNSLAFDDEGGALAFGEWVSEAEAELEEARDGI